MSGAWLIEFKIPLAFVTITDFENCSIRAFSKPCTADEQRTALQIQMLI
jgi:hypothetical protein